MQAADGEYPTVALQRPAGQARQWGGVITNMFCLPPYRCSMRPAGQDAHWGPAAEPVMHSQNEEFRLKAYKHVPRLLQR